MAPNRASHHICTPAITNLQVTHQKLGLTWRWRRYIQVATSKTNLVSLFCFEVELLIGIMQIDNLNQSCNGKDKLAT